MAKKRRTTSSKVVLTNKKVTDVFGAMVKKAHKELGGTVSIGTEAGTDLVGLQLPALSLRYLFQSTVFPLGRMIQITGQEGSAKSAFLYDIMRWHSRHGGGNVLAENENKDSPELRHSMLEWNAHWLDRLVVKPTYSLEEWQDVFTTFVQIAREQQDAKDGPGRTIPICFAVDSVMSTAPQDEINKVLESGHATRGFALAANLIARYMRTMPERIQNYPFTVACTNHLKPGTTPQGFPTSTIPGGMSVKFMETYEIQMAKAAQGADIDKLEYGGLRVVFKAKKNSLGPSRKSITAELLWWFSDAGDGIFRQRTMWDWDAASIELLLSFANAKGKKTLFNLLQDICDLHPNKTNKTVWSNVLGIPESDPQPYRVAGQILEQRQDVLVELYKLLGITPRHVFKPGEDFRIAQQKAMEVAKRKEQAELYAAVETLPKVDMSNSVSIPATVVTEGQDFSPEYEPTPEELAAEAAETDAGEMAEV